MNKKEFDEGYQAAIEAIRKKLQGQNDNNGGGGSGNGLGLPLDLPQDPSDQQDSQGGSQQGDNGEENQSRGEGSTGVVRPEDCMGPSNLRDLPSVSGTFMDKTDGDKLAESEGYEKEGGSQSSIDKNWKDASLKASSQMKGDGPGGLKAKIEGLYKTAKDWRKELRNIVGHAISPEDKRQAYANKNVLVSQDRISRTDKDRYDNVDYIMACIDSSMSMSDDQLKRCLSEVYEIALRKKPMNIIIVQCDTMIQSIEKYSSVKELKNSIKNATVKGRGGTELRPCWDLLKNDKKFSRIKPELVMIFTDGELTQYKRDPRTMRNLCWVILDNPSFNVQYKDANTKCIHINTADIK